MISMDEWRLGPPILVGERIAWLGSGSGIPQSGTVRWIGKLPEIGSSWAVGLELDKPMPFGGIDGSWGKRKLFSCEPKHGLIVPLDKVVKESSLLQARHSVGGDHEHIDAKRDSRSKNQILLRKISVPQSHTPKEFLQRVLPQPIKRSDCSATSTESTGSGEYGYRFKTAAAEVQAQKPEPKVVPLSIANVKSHQDSFEDVSKFQVLDLCEKSVLSRENQDRPRRSKRRPEGETVTEVKSKAPEIKDLVRAPSNNRLPEALNELAQFKKLLDAPVDISLPDTLNELDELKKILETPAIKSLPDALKELDQFKKNLEDVSERKKTERTKHHKHRKICKVSKNPESLYERAKLQQETVEELDVFQKLEKTEFARTSTPVHAREIVYTPFATATVKKEIPEIGKEIVRELTDQGSPEFVEEIKHLGVVDRSEVAQIVQHPLATAQARANVTETIQHPGPAEQLSLEPETQEPTPTLRKRKDRSNPIPLPRKKVESRKRPESVYEIFESSRSIDAISIGKNETESAKNSVDEEHQLWNHRTKSGEFENYEWHDANQFIDTASVLYEPAFLKDFIEQERQEKEAGAVVDEEKMTEVRERFRRIEDEDSFESAVEHLEDDGSRKQKLRGSERRERGSGLFSFLKWFRKDKEREEVEVRAASATSSPLFLRSRVNSCGSIDTLYSIATVNSFAFVPPAQYPAAPAPSPTRVPSTPESVRHRLRQRQQITKPVNLIEKYKLFPSDVSEVRVKPNDSVELAVEESNVTAVESDEYSTLGKRKKRKAPEPPRGDTSLPNTLEYKKQSDDEDTSNVVCHHRRTVSESFKDKRAGAYCHVQGKRKAPLPPPSAPPAEKLYPSLGSLKNQYPSFGKKRTAPLPPDKKPTEPEQSLGASENVPNVRETELSNEDIEDDEAVNGEYDTIASEALEEIGQPAMHLKNQRTEDGVFYNDTLRLEKGVLKPNRVPSSISQTPDVAKVVPLSPVSPRPWYKRHKEMNGGNMIKRDIFKSLEKKKEKDEDWMPEVGFSRPHVPTDIAPSSSSTPSRFNIFARLERNDGKKEEKRKSQISMLANISELDREAAEIVRKEHAQELEMMAANDAKYYSYPEVPDVPLTYKSPTPPEPDPGEVPRRNSARELISLFNAIGNVTKMTVNTTFFGKENGLIEKRSESKVQERWERVSSPVERRKLPFAPSDRFDVTTPNAVDRKLYGTEKTETEQETASKAQALYEARTRRHHSPSPTIPTIAELSETTSSVATTPASTINTYEETPRNSLPLAAKETAKETAKPPLELGCSNTWACTRCTLENARWRVLCEACNYLRPSFGARTNELRVEVDKRNSDMDMVIDWEEELKKYFPEKKTEKKVTPQDHGKTSAPTFSKDRDVLFNTDLHKKQDERAKEDFIMQQDLNQDVRLEPIQNKDELDVDEQNIDKVRKKRLAFFTKSTRETNLGSIRDAAAKKSLDETEKLKLKEMLKEMKNSLPKHEKGVINNVSNHNLNNESDKEVNVSEGVNLQHVDGEIKKVTRISNGLPDERFFKSIGEGEQTPCTESDAHKYGAIKKVKHAPEGVSMEKSTVRQKEQVAEALLITTTTILEDIIVQRKPDKSQKVSSAMQTNAMVRKPPRGEPALPVAVEHFSTVGLRNGVPYTSIKKARKIGAGSFELIRARDLAGIVKTKTGHAFPATTTHVYANMPPSPNCAFGKDENGILKVCYAQGNARDETRSPSVASSVESDGSEVERLTTKLTQAQGLAEFRADIEASPPDKNMNTLSVNRLLRRLEAAIAGGQHLQAAGLAKELARLKISCSVTRQRPVEITPRSISVDMYVEDKVSHQGPIPLVVSPDMTVTELKAKVELELEIPAGVQRWILGKQLAGEDFRTLEEHGVTTSGYPVFLYLVAPEPEEPEENASAAETSIEKQTGNETNEEQQPRPFGKGWYYNFDEDRYSYCEDSERSEIEDNDDEEMREDSPVMEEAAALRLVQRPVEIVQTPSELPLKLEEATKEESQEQKAEPGSAPQTPRLKARSRSIDLPKPEIKETLKKDLKVISVNAVKDTIDRLHHIAATKTDRGTTYTNTLSLGWKCPLCTLVNPPTRPGCKACTAARPINYVIPTQYRANEMELARMRREQQLDQQMKTTDGVAAGAVGLDKEHYLELVHLDNAELVLNQEPFECPVCLADVIKHEGVTLRDCLHTFCRACLMHTVQFSEEAEVKCPYRDEHYACDSVLQEREIKALVPRGVYEQHLAKSMSQAENKIGNAFHCKTPDCTGWCILADNVNSFCCPVCRKTNCLTCQAVHEALDCRQYQERVKADAETDVEARRTRHMLEEMVERGEAMSCPTCQVVLMKKWGCDWLRCSMCKTEICWVTRGPRWGPQGKGDTTGGCQCGLNGVKCHPKCNYCH